MTSDRIAVIDLGSNTFHLLICALNETGDFIQIYKSRVYVKLASGGLGFIDADSEERGLQAMLGFANQIKQFGVTRVKAVGTSALREASNGKEVVDKYFKATGIPIEIIDGIQEADYILGGTLAAIPSMDQPALIMDIGGGSVEFILFNNKDILFKGSYKIGVSVLFKSFHHTDPISKDNLKALELFLDSQLSDLFIALDALDDYYLIGSSGSFEVIQNLLPHLSTDTNWSELDIQQLPSCLDKIIPSSLDQRIEIPEIPAERLDYIVVAFVLIKYLISRCLPQKLFYCDFALKEGVLAELARKT